MKNDQLGLLHSVHDDNSNSNNNNYNYTMQGTWRLTSDTLGLISLLTEGNVGKEKAEKNKQK